MNRRQIALKLLLDDLGVPSSMSSFNDRLILQKTVYLVQEMGLALGYHFSWYLRGPYSTDLASDAFANINTERPAGWTLGGNAEDILPRIRSLIESVKAQTNPARELERLAWVLYVIKTGQESEKEADKITARMKKAGKDFTQGEVDGAIQILRENRLLSKTKNSRR